jgi:hypothetical protein
MITYPKAIRTVLYHLVSILPARRNPTGRSSTGEKMDTEGLSVRLPVEVVRRLEAEAAFRTGESTGHRWSKTQCIEQALLWYFELCEHGRDFLTQTFEEAKPEK